MGWLKKAKKAVKKAVKQTTGLVKDVVKPVTNTAENLAKSSVGVVTNLAEGNIGKALSNAANVATMGTVDTTGNKNGIVNIHATKYINNALAGITGVKAISSSSAETPFIEMTKKKKGLVSQLRQGKGSIGGGSYTTTVKNPLGGSSGLTGK